MLFISIVDLMLSLCIVHASKLPLVRNIMDTMQEATLAFKFSAKRLFLFKEQLGDNPVAREEMGRRSKLKVLCETRWASGADCQAVFFDAFKVLIDINNLNHSPSFMSYIQWNILLIHQCSFSGYSRHVRPAKRGR